jgi:hypothetical protein
VAKPRPRLRPHKAAEAAAARERGGGTVAHDHRVEAADRRQQRGVELEAAGVALAGVVVDRAVDAVAGGAVGRGDRRLGPGGRRDRERDEGPRRPGP